MAKTKDKETKVEVTGEFYKISAKQLYETTSKRKVIPLTLSADVGLGGGIPVGCTVLIGGKPKLGKTTMSLQYAANAQNLYGMKVFFFNAEGRLTKHVLSQIQNIKLDAEWFQVINSPALIDKDGEVVGFKKWPAHRWWDELGKCITENPNCVIIFDSIAALSSEKELSEEMGYQDRGGKNKLESEFQRKYGDVIVPNRVTLFLLTHIQANTSGYGPSQQAKVGNSIRHMADVMLFGQNFEKWPEEGGRINGHNMNYTVEASALGPPFMKLEIPLRYGYGIDITKDLITHAINWEIIKKGGAWYTMPFTQVAEDKFEVCDPDSEDVKPVKLNGENGIRNWLLVRPEQMAALDKMVRAKVFGEG